MADATETYRRAATVEMQRMQRAQMEAQYGQVWTTVEMQKEFEAKGFMAPFIVVRRKSTGQMGSLMFGGSPRFYFSWQED